MSYINRVSCGYVHIDVTSIIIDQLLTKRYIDKNEPYLIKSLAVITVLLKDHGISEAKSIQEIFKVIEKKAKTEIHEFEFFKVYKSLFLKDGQTSVN